jgi:hypothetical protein
VNLLASNILLSKAANASPILERSKSSDDARIYRSDLGTSEGLDTNEKLVILLFASKLNLLMVERKLFLGRLRIELKLIGFVEVCSKATGFVIMERSFIFLRTPFSRKS